MDPLSVTTAVTGFVSLGIQVVGGLVTYLDAIKDREDDLRAANDRVQQLHRQIKTVNTVTEQIGVQHLGASDDVKHCIVSCEKQLKELEDFLVEIGGGQQVTQTTPVPRSSRLKDAIEQIKKKGSYPFRRSKIKMLRTRLDNTVDALQTALITLDLLQSSVSSKNILEIRSLDQSIGTRIDLGLARTDLQLQSQSHQIETVERFLPQIDQNIAAAKSAIDAVGSGVKLAQVSILDNVAMSADATIREIAALRDTVQERCQRESETNRHIEAALRRLSSSSSAVGMTVTTLPTDAKGGRGAAVSSANKISEKARSPASRSLGAPQYRRQDWKVPPSNQTLAIPDAGILGRAVRMELREQLEPVLNRLEGVRELIDQIASAVAEQTSEEEVSQAAKSNMARLSGGALSPDDSNLSPIEVADREPLHTEPPPQTRTNVRRREVTLFTWSFFPCTAIGNFSIQIATYRILGSLETYFRLKLVFLPKLWLLSRGLSIIYSSGPNGYDHYDLCPSIRPIRIFPDESSVWDVFEQDDVLSFRMMLQQGEMSISDLTESGLNLLEYAIFCKSSTICRYLLQDSGYGEILLSVTSRDYEWCTITDVVVSNSIIAASDILQLLKDHAELSEDIARSSATTWANLVICIRRDEYSFPQAIHLARLFLDSGAIIDPFDHCRRDFIERSIRLNLYLELGGNPNQVDENGSPLILIALILTHCHSFHLREPDDGLLTALISAGADIYSIHDVNDYGEQLLTLTDWAYKLDIEDIWDTALSKCGFDLDTVKAQSALRLREYYRLLGATRTGVDVGSLVDRVSSSEIRHRGKTKWTIEDDLN